MRATYLYCGMADEAYEYGDDAMFQACRALFRNITDKRMYITGGIGSSSSGEAFTKDYDLPNETAYTESCAAIGLALFARRMLRLERFPICGHGGTGALQRLSRQHLAGRQPAFSMKTRWRSTCFTTGAILP